MKERERRYKCVNISPEHILDLFREPKQEILYRLGFEGIPEDAEVVTLMADPINHVVRFLIWHPSFDVVPEGDYTPSVQGVVELRFRKVEGYEVVPDVVVG